MVINETGNRYGRLIVINRLSNNRHGSAIWLCQCDCGTMLSVRGNSLRQGHHQSCGCYNQEKNKTHGMTKTPEFKAWQMMHQRCSNPNDKRFCHYGKRGIRVTPEWESFDVFFADMGHRPSIKHSLNRIDNDGPYCKENCEWATDTAQSRNRRGLRLLSHEGLSLPLSEWCERKELKRSCVTTRLRNNWSVSKSLNTPSRGA